MRDVQPGPRLDYVKLLGVGEVWDWSMVHLQGLKQEKAVPLARKNALPSGYD